MIAALILAAVFVALIAVARYASRHPTPPAGLTFTPPRRHEPPRMLPPRRPSRWKVTPSNTLADPNIGNANSGDYRQ
jgi:hypothetical protein